MPSFSSDYHTVTPPPVDSPQGKPHEKAPVGNTFLWTNNWPNGDAASHRDAAAPSTDRLTNLKNASAYSVNGHRSSISSSHNRDLPQSKDGSMYSLGNGSARDPRDTGRPSTTLDRDIIATGSGAGSATASISSQQFMGASQSSRSLNNGRPTVNGDYTPRPSVDQFVASDSVANASMPTLSSSQPEESFGRLSSDPSRLSPRTTSPHRYSSPPIPSGIDGAASGNPPQSPTQQQQQDQSSLRHRHTLQVPRSASARRNSRDHSEDTAHSSGRLSPTAGIRRTSMSLARRTTRTNQSDSIADETVPDEDAARYAEAIKQRRASKRRRRDDDDEDRVIVGTKVDQNHVNWVTAYNMLTGIRFTVSRINAKLERELTPADFEAKHKFSFDMYVSPLTVLLYHLLYPSIDDMDSTGNELVPSAKYDFKFKDYAPWVFRSLRAKFRIDPADYLMSLTSKYILSELGSPGKSGSFFYFSRDYKYIIKTIHHAEHKLLRRILPEYYKHVEKNPNTLISQFYGLHRVKMAYGRKIHFVVMNNLFPPHRDIHQTFDLKGSTIGRDLHESDLEKNPRATLKDLNWVRRSRHLECGPTKREFFIAQLQRDVELLKRLKIMDYSLLVGIHDLERGNEEKLRDKTLQVFQPGGDREEDQSQNMLMRTPSKLESERKARELRMLIKRERPVPLDKAAAKMPEEILDERKYHVFYADDGGFRATHENGSLGEEIYYLGIIDCLTHVSCSVTFSL